MYSSDFPNILRFASLCFHYALLDALTCWLLIDIQSWIALILSHCFYKFSSQCVCFWAIVPFQYKWGHPLLNLDTVVSSPVFLILSFPLNFSLPGSSDSVEEAQALLKWKASLQSHNWFLLPSGINATTKCSIQ